jgi:acetyl-CoA decarbonylase/synthase complex subunit gamma
MKLAAGQAELDACPHLSAEIREKLEEASAPPVRQVIIGTGDSALKIGGETVLFRHEKTFVNNPGIGVLIKDTMPPAEVAAKLEQFKKLTYERVGLTLTADIVALQCTSGDEQKFAALIGNVIKQGITTLVLISEKPELLAAGAKSAAGCKPLLYCATKDTLDEVVAIAREHGCSITVRGSGIDQTAELTEKLATMKFKDIVIDTGADEFTQAFRDNVIVRRLAVVKKLRSLGYPTIVFPCLLTDDLMYESVIASAFIAKYAGIIILSELEGHNLFPLALQRMNIYTDPQRPMATTEGVYEINNPDETSPVVITSNFSLTYFIVSSEIESSRVPTWLLIKDAEGLSVLTAWAAGKFSADSIAPFVKKSTIEDKIKHRKLIIPGAVASISGELDEALEGWEIQIGPREASALTAYLKNWTPA